jgi:hypothetical protein
MTAAKDSTAIRKTGCGARRRHAPSFVTFGSANPGQNRPAWRVAGRKGLFQTFIDFVFAPIVFVDMGPGRLMAPPDRRLLSPTPPDGPGPEGFHAAL